MALSDDDLEKIGKLMENAAKRHKLNLGRCSLKRTNG